MNKREILDKLYERKGAESDKTKKEQIDNICNLLKTLPDFEISKKIPEIEIYLNDATSRMDGDMLKIIIDKLKGQISEVESHTIKKSYLDKLQKPMCDKNKQGKTKTGRDFWIPLIVSIIVLAIGLSLGLTIFAERQDALYFTLESIKDILGSIMAGLTANQAINAKKNKRNNAAIIIIGAIVGLFALVFAIVLWIGANLAVIERFTYWSKLTYLWTSITISLISIICTVCVVWYLLSYQPRYKEKGRNIL